MQRYATFGMLLDFTIVLEYKITIQLSELQSSLSPLTSLYPGGKSAYLNKCPRGVIAPTQSTSVIISTCLLLSTYINQPKKAKNKFTFLKNYTIQHVFPPGFHQPSVHPLPTNPNCMPLSLAAMLAWVEKPAAIWFALERHKLFLLVEMSRKERLRQRTFKQRLRAPKTLSKFSN
jgi:hypothetical protein